MSAHILHDAPKKLDIINVSLRQRLFNTDGVETTILEIGGSHTFLHPRLLLPRQILYDFFYLHATLQQMKPQGHPYISLALAALISAAQVRLLPVMCSFLMLSRPVHHHADKHGQV